MAKNEKKDWKDAAKEGVRQSLKVFKGEKDIAKAADDLRRNLGDDAKKDRK